MGFGYMLNAYWNELSLYQLSKWLVIACECGVVALFMPPEVVGGFTAQPVGQTVGCTIIWNNLSYQVGY